LGADAALSGRAGGGDTGMNLATAAAGQGGQGRGDTKGEMARSRLQWLALIGMVVVDPGSLAKTFEKLVVVMVVGRQFGTGIRRVGKDMLLVW